MEQLWVILSLLVGIAVGVYGAYLVTRSRAAAAQARADLLHEALEAERDRGGDDERLLRELAPVRDELQRMRAMVQLFDRDRATLHGQLSEQLRVQAQSDAELRAATESLSAALRSSSARGSWGEAQLRNLLESTGMLEHVDFDLQVHVDGDAGRLRPDAVVHLPGEHALIIDAKAPMQRYLEAMRVPTPGDADDQKLRDRLLAEHATAVRRHLDALRARDYPAAVTGAARLVIAYIPSESALAAAVGADPSLLDDAFRSDIALASPTTLWAILRAVAAAWQQDRLEESVEEVLELSSELYRRLSTAGTHLAKVGRELNSSVEAYNKLVGSMETRVLVTARKLAEFDAASSPLPKQQQVSALARPIAAPELGEFEGGDH